MEPIFGFLLFFVATIIVAVVAKKRGRAWWAYALFCLVVGFIMVPLVARAGGTGMNAAVGAFLVPLAALVFLLSSNTSEAVAVEKGEHGAFRKCPFCAEPIRREAVKCKHCGSAVEPS
jgi:hypothetical protein